MLRLLFPESSVHLKISKTSLGFFPVVNFDFFL